MNDKKKIVYLILIIGILGLVALNIVTFINNNYEENQVSEGNILNTIENKPLNTDYNTVSAEVDEKNREDKISSLSEQLRMETYFGQYISLIESKDYEGAYDLLYDEFKQTYFPALEDFISYAQENYPSNMVVEYTNMERQGTIFILYVKIRNPLTDRTDSEVQEQRVVILENSVNDFKLSFEIV